MTGRVWCSHSYQGAIHDQGTADVVLGPDCPVHKAPMHRAPAVPQEVTHWVCHGYDGEGCAEIAVTQTGIL